jgi:hypothetical protein
MSAQNHTFETQISNRQTPPIQILPAVLTVNDMIQFSRSSRATVYAAIKSGSLKTFKRGKRRFCLVNEFLGWLSASV